MGKIRFAHDSEVKHWGVPRLAFVIATFSFVVYLIPGMFGAPLKALAGYFPPQETIDFDINRIVRESTKAILANGGGGSGRGPRVVSELAYYFDFFHSHHRSYGDFNFENALIFAF